MEVLVDIRERAPFTFKGYQVATEPATLPVGDHSLPGFQDRTARAYNGPGCPPALCA